MPSRRKGRSAPGAAVAPFVEVVDAPRLPRARFDRLDALRGAAIVWMAAFHFSFDLDHFGFIHQDFHRNPVWTNQRLCIVTLFLLCAGAGQAIALAEEQTLARFWRRWAQIAACALLVSVGSWWMFPRSFISFGVLHGVALMLIIVRFTATWGAWRWLLGLGAILLPNVWSSHVFDSRWTDWIGPVTHPPLTEDFVPLLPWLGVMWWGAAAGAWLLAHRRAAFAGAIAPTLRPFATLGRWSLTFYMLHQPLLIGMLLALHWALGAAT